MASPLYSLLSFEKSRNTAIRIADGSRVSFTKSLIKVSKVFVVRIESERIKNSFTRQTMRAEKNPMRIAGIKFLKVKSFWLKEYQIITAGRAKNINAYMT